MNDTAARAPSWARMGWFLGLGLAYLLAGLAGYGWSAVGVYGVIAAVSAAAYSGLKPRAVLPSSSEQTLARRGIRFIVHTVTGLLVVVGLAMVLSTLAPGLNRAPGDENPLSLGPAFRVYATAAVGIPVIEEVLFRGLLFDVLKERFATRTTIAATAVLFACAHAINGVGSVAGALLLGLVLGAVRGVSGGIVSSVVIHCVNNALVVFART